MKLKLGDKVKIKFGTSWFTAHDCTIVFEVCHVKTSGTRDMVKITHDDMFDWYWLPAECCELVNNKMKKLKEHFFNIKEEK